MWNSGLESNQAALFRKPSACVGNLRAQSTVSYNDINRTGRNAVVTVERPATIIRIPDESTHLCGPLPSSNKAVNHTRRLPFYERLSISVEGLFRDSISTQCPSATESIYLYYGNMIHNMAIALLVILGAVVHASAIQFNCSTLLPSGMTAKDSLKNTAFQLEVIDDKQLPTSTFTPGGKLTVVLKGDLPIDTFVLQARAPLGDVPLGRWQTKHFKQTTFSCRDGVADTVISAEKVEVQKVEAMWLAPENADLKEIEFVASVKNADGKFWYDFHSVIVEIEVTPTPTPVVDEEGEEGRSHYDRREYEETGHNNENEEEEEEGGHEQEEESETGESRTGEDPNEAERTDEKEREEANARDAAGEAADRRAEAEGHNVDHDLATEEELAIKYAEKQREMAEAEERTGEKWIGAATRKADRVKAEMEKERQSYERMRTLEETETEHRMEMERRDKEEFEASQRLKENGKGDDEIEDSVLPANGSGHVVATVYGAILAVVTALLL